MDEAPNTTGVENAASDVLVTAGLVLATVGTTALWGWAIGCLGAGVALIALGVNRARRLDP